MEEIKLIVDSSSNDRTSTDNDITVVPLTLTISGENFVDNQELNIDYFIEKMAKNKEEGKTSCPSIDAWLNALEGSKRAIIITVTSGLSGCYDSAFQAKNIYEKDNPDSSIIVVDSLSAGPELSVILSKIKKLIKDGIAFEDLENKIKEIQQHTHLLAILQSLHNLSLNGRVSPAVAKVAQLLKIAIVGKASDEGKLEPISKARGMQRAIKEVIKRMQEMDYSGGEVIIDHCNNAKDAQLLKEKLRDLYPSAQITIRSMCGLCTFYAEDGGLMIGFVG